MRKETAGMLNGTVPATHSSREHYFKTSMTSSPEFFFVPLLFYSTDHSFPTC